MNPAIGQLLEQASIDALLITGAENRYYLSGFTGDDGLLLITPQEITLLTDFRYIEQAGIECPEIALKCIEGSVYHAISSVIEGTKIGVIGFEAEDLSYDQYIKLKTNLENIEFKPTHGLVENLRIIKNDGEISRIKRAAEIADRAFLHILNSIKPGVKESDIALEMEYFMRKEGAEGISFDFIVASGARSALPHGKASEKTIQNGELLTLDFGAVYQKYHSDMTRTVIVGEPDQKQKQIYDVVLEAQLAGIASVGPGVRASEIDAAARNIIAGYGYGEHFRHSTGHGVGLAVHEEPRIAQKNDFVIRPGMVITVEPGIYLPGWGGVRIEDMVVVTETGSEVITKSPKGKLIQMGGAKQ